MKNLFVSLLFVVLMVSGCGKESVDKDETKTTTSASKDNVKSDESNDTKMLNLEKQVEQFGGESFSEQGLNTNSHIVDKSGYTYVLTPELNDGDYFKLYVSILKDDKFIIKEKEIDLTPTFGIEFTNNLMQYGFFENNLLMNVTDDKPFSDNNNEKLISVAISESGEVKTNIIKEGTWFLSKNKIIKGLKGSYFNDCIDDQCNVINYKGETLFTYTQGETHPDGIWEPLFLDEDTEIIYFPTDDDDLGMISRAFDIKTSDMIWETDGKEKMFSFPTRKASYIGGNKTLYVLKSVNSTEKTLYAYSLGNNEPTLSVEASLISKIENKYPADYDITLDNKYINVYSNVIYKGRPTLQKYSYTRIDKGGKSQGSKEKNQITNGKTGLYDTSDPSSYIGTWKYHFKEDDENSGGYIITLKPKEGSQDSYDVVVEELTPGATFINGSESTIGFSTGKGIYEFMSDANDNSGAVEIELATDGIVYKKKMYTTNPGKFNEDVEVKLTKKE